MDANQQVISSAKKGVARSIALLERAPKLDNDFYYAAFNDLSTMRPAGMGLSLIPLDKIDWYAERDELDILEKSALESVIRAVDIDYVNRHANQSSKTTK